MFIRTPIFFAPDDDLGGGAPPAAEIPSSAPEGEPVGEVVEGQPLASPQAAAPAEPEAAPDPFTDFGGRDEVEQATNLYRSLGTEQGVTRLFVEAGRSLGVDPARLEALFSDDPQAAADALGDDEDLDLPLTKREVLDMLKEQVHAPLAQQREEEQMQVVAQGLNSTLDQLEVTDPENRDTILRMADKFITEDQLLDPRATAAAVQKAHTAWKAQVEAEVQRIVQTKAATHEALPTPLSGGGAGGGDEPKPITFEEFGGDVMAEAIRRARARTSA